MQNQLWVLDRCRCGTKLGHHSWTQLYVYYQRDNYRQFFDYKDVVCDPLTYSVLLPHGDVGWYPNSQKVTLVHYYGYITSIRPGFDPILRSRDLFQQYLVDAYSKVLKNRLDYIATDQKSLWAEEFQRLQNLGIVGADGHINQEFLNQHVDQRKFRPACLTPAVLWSEYMTTQWELWLALGS